MKGKMVVMCERGDLRGILVTTPWDLGMRGNGLRRMGRWEGDGVKGLGKGEEWEEWVFEGLVVVMVDSDGCDVVVMIGVVVLTGV